MRNQADLKGLDLPRPANHLYFLVNESRKTLYSIQNGLNL